MVLLGSGVRCCQQCYTIKCDTVENDLIERASEGNPAGKEVNPMLSGETGNLVVEIDVKKNVEEGSMMANTELLEA
jgi:hypothetical protein